MGHHLVWISMGAGKGEGFQGLVIVLFWWFCHLQVFVGDDIANSWVMFNWNIYQPLDLALQNGELTIKKGWLMHRNDATVAWKKWRLNPLKWWFCCACSQFVWKNCIQKYSPWNLKSVQLLVSESALFATEMEEFATDTTIDIYVAICIFKGSLIRLASPFYDMEVHLLFCGSGSSWFDTWYSYWLQIAGTYVKIPLLSYVSPIHNH